MLLKDKRITPNHHAIYEAVENGHTEIVKMLLKRVDPISEQSGDFVRIAAKHGHTETVKALLQDKRIHPSEWEYSGIYRAIRNGHKDTAKAMIQSLLQDKRSNPLHWANLIIDQVVENDLADVLKVLLADKRIQNNISSAKYDKLIQSKSKSREIREMLVQAKKKRSNIPGPIMSGVILGALTLGVIAITSSDSSHSQ
jgi:ankyrin repeat protein